MFPESDWTRLLSVAQAHSLIVESELSSLHDVSVFGDGPVENSIMTTPLSRALAKLEEIERELRKLPDFHLYLLAKTETERARMEAILIKIPAFDLWHKLRNSVARAAEPSRALAERAAGSFAAT